MYRQIFNNDNITIAMDEKNETMVIDWKKECGNINNGKNTNEIEAMRNFINKVKPPKLLVNMSPCVYRISPDTGPWYENELFSMYADLPPRKIALIIPRNLFAHAFFDAASARENLDPNTRMQYFDELNKAKEWLDKVEPLKTQI